MQTRFYFLAKLFDIAMRGTYKIIERLLSGFR